MKQSFKIKDIPLLIFSIFVCQLAGIIGSIFTARAVPRWYATLSKPWFTPPSWVFAPVWITLYTMMGISFYLVLKQGIKLKDIRIPGIIFIIQLILNSLWSIIFFGMRQPYFAFVEIIVLLIFIFLTIITFFKVSKTAGYLLIPYIAWVFFAAILNYAIWQLNI